MRVDSIGVFPLEGQDNAKDRILQTTRKKNPFE